MVGYKTKIKMGKIQFLKLKWFDKLKPYGFTLDGEKSYKNDTVFGNDYLLFINLPVQMVEKVKNMPAPFRTLEEDIKDTINEVMQRKQRGLKNNGIKNNVIELIIHYHNGGVFTGYVGSITNTNNNWRYHREFGCTRDDNDQYGNIDFNANRW
jgi:hypothetical protein